MSPISRYAVLLDGGFVVKKLQSALKRFPVADDVEALCDLTLDVPLPTATQARS